MKAFCDCPAIISHRPESQNILKEAQLNPEKDSRIKQGSIFWSKTDIYSPPPSEIYIFSPKKQRDFRATLPTTNSVNYRSYRK